MKSRNSLLHKADIIRQKRVRWALLPTCERPQRHYKTTIFMRLNDGRQSLLKLGKKQKSQRKNLWTTGRQVHALSTVRIVF